MGTENIDHIRRQEDGACDCHLIAERASIGIVVINEEGRVVYANPELCRMLGYSREELYHLPIFLEAVHPEDRPLVFEQFTKRVKGEPALSTYVFRLFTKDGRTIWVENHASVVDWQGKRAVLGYLTEITQRRQAQEMLKEKIREVRELLNGSIKALSAAIEKRDPYTAGHQQRVAELSREIAKVMGLSESQIEGLYLAALVHDVGKIYVPAEILNRPGKVTDIELAMIRTHPQVGYEILKSIDFEWPIAEIVLQHHERLDGSGYPLQLRGTEIMIEARIIAVADVVEAMASHRPYRPSLGLDKALEAVKEARGVLFDPEVVDACLYVFASGFKLGHRPTVPTYGIPEEED